MSTCIGHRQRSAFQGGMKQTTNERRAVALPKQNKLFQHLVSEIFGILGVHKQHLQTTESQHAVVSPARQNTLFRQGERSENAGTHVVKEAFERQLCLRVRQEPAEEALYQGKGARSADGGSRQLPPKWNGGAEQRAKDLAWP